MLFSLQLFKTSEVIDQPANPGAGGDSQGASKEWSRWDLLLEPNLHKITYFQ